jgi:hypothetical protein
MKEGMAQNETTFFHAGTRCQMLSSLGETNEEFIFASSFSSVPPELHKLTHLSHNFNFSSITHSFVN